MRRRRRRSNIEVELNLAAMLDMAFQLLAFFILTFRPSPIEGQVKLHMPPPRPITTLPDGKAPGDDPKDAHPLQGLNTIVISVLASPTGQIAGLSIGDSAVPDVDALATRLRAILADPGIGFDQILVQVGSELSYQSLMDVVDVCTRQKLSTGEQLTKLGFVEIAATNSGPVTNGPR